MGVLRAMVCHVEGFEVGGDRTRGNPLRLTREGVGANKNHVEGVHVHMRRGQGILQGVLGIFYMC
jgi:hypothetical protein